MERVNIESYEQVPGWDEIISDTEKPLFDVMTQMRSGTQLLISILMESYKSQLIEFQEGKLVEGDRIRVTKNVHGFNTNYSNETFDVFILKRHHYHNRQYPLDYRLRIILLGDVERSLISDLYSLRQTSKNAPVDYKQREYFDEFSKEWLLIKPYYDDLLAWYSEISSSTYGENVIILNTLNHDSVVELIDWIEEKIGLKPRGDIGSLAFNFPKKYSAEEVLSKTIRNYLDAFSNYTNL
jgi:hypothetical protein